MNLTGHVSGTFSCNNHPDPSENRQGVLNNLGPSTSSGSPRTTVAPPPAQDTPSLLFILNPKTPGGDDAQDGQVLNIPAEVRQDLLQRRQAHADQVLAGGMLGYHEFQALADLSRSALIFLWHNPAPKQEGVEVACVVEPHIAPGDRNPAVFILNNREQTHFDAFMPADYKSKWAGSGEQDIARLKQKDVYLKGDIIHASGQNNDCLLESIRKFAQTAEPAWQPFSLGNREIRHYLGAKVMDTDPDFFACISAPASKSDSDIKPPPDKHDRPLFERICKMDVHQLGDIARFFLAGSRLLDISQNRGGVDIGVLQHCPKAVDFYRNEADRLDEHPEQWHLELFAELAEHIRQMTPSNQWGDLGERLDLLENFVSIHGEEKNVDTLVRSWIEFVVKLTGSDPGERKKALDLFPLAKHAQEWTMCLGGMQSRLEEARSSLQLIEESQTGILQERIGKDLQLCAGIEIHATTFLKYLLGLPEDVARKQDYLLFAARYEITGKQAFGIIEPSCFGHDMRAAILSMAAEYEQLLQNACENDMANLSQVYATIENHPFFKEIGFPLQTEDGMRRYIDYDFDENDNEIITFRKKQFTVDLAFRLTRANCLSPDVEIREQGLSRDDQPMVRDAAGAYWDDRLEHPERLVQDIKGADLLQKAKALYMVVAMAQGCKEHLVWSAYRFFTLVSGEELAEAVDQCRKNNLIQLSLDHLLEARANIEEKGLIHLVGFPLQVAKLVDVALGLSSETLNLGKIPRATFDQALDVLLKGKADNDSLFRFLLEYKRRRQNDHLRTCLRNCKIGGRPELSPKDPISAKVLHLAMERGDLGFLQKLFDLGIDVKTADGNGANILHMAAQAGQNDITAFLLSVTAIDINQTDRDGCTALYYAAQNGHADIVKALLAVKGINIKKANDKGATALHTAANNGYAEIVNILLATQCFNVNQANHKGAAALHLAAFRGRIETVNALLAVPDIDINQVDRRNRSALFLATAQMDTPIVTALLAAPGINVNQANYKGATPLHLAAHHENIEIVNALLAAPGINVNQVDRRNRSALFLASTYRCTRVVTALLAAPGINVNQANYKGATPLFIAAAKGYAGIVKALLTTPGIVADGDGYAALRRAAANGYTEIVNALIEKSLALPAGGNTASRRGPALSRTDFWVDPESSSIAMPLHIELTFIRMELEMLMAKLTKRLERGEKLAPEDLRQDLEQKAVFRHLIDPENKFLAVAVLNGLDHNYAPGVAILLRKKKPKQIKDVLQTMLLGER